MKGSLTLSLLEIAESNLTVAKIIQAHTAAKYLKGVCNIWVTALSRSSTLPSEAKVRSTSLWWIQSHGDLTLGGPLHDKIMTRSLSLQPLSYTSQQESSQCIPKESSWALNPHTTYKLLKHAKWTLPLLVSETSLWRILALEICGVHSACELLPLPKPFRLRIFWYFTWLGGGVLKDSQ